MSQHSWSAALTALPKVELYVHLEGTVRAETARELARKNGVRCSLDPSRRPLGHDGERELREGMGLIRSVLRTRQDWALAAYESVLAAAATGIVHREVTFTPARQIAAGVSLADVVAGIDDGLTAGERECGLVTRTIYGIDRSLGPASALQQVEMLALVRRAQVHGIDRVIGIGMGGTDLDGELSAFAAAYRLAATMGLRRGVHVGTSSAAAVTVALDELACERIDHGAAALADPVLVERLVAARTPLNLSPSEDVAIGPPGSSLADHPFAALRAAGLLITLSSAAPALTGVSLAEEYRTASRAFALDWEAMASLAMSGVEAAWVDADERRRLAERVDRAVRSLRPAA